MKKWMLLLVCFSCTPKEVDLMLIDKLTGGNSKEWKLTGFSLDGTDILADCNLDDTAVFTKINPDSLRGGPVFEYRKNTLRCGDEKDTELRSFWILENRRLLIFDSFEEWEIEYLDQSELVLFRSDGFRKIVYKSI